MDNIVVHDHLPNYVVFDFETTGTSPYKHSIIEIGAVKVIDGKVASTFSELVHPNQVLTDLTTELTGISNAMIRDARTKVEVMDDFLEFIGVLPLVAHNARFDLSFLVENTTLDKFINPVFDTLELSKKVLDLTSYKLESVAYFLGIDAKPNHRALQDSIVTQKVFELIMSSNILLDNDINILSYDSISKDIFKRQLQVTLSDVYTSEFLMDNLRLCSKDTLKQILNNEIANVYELLEDDILNIINN